MRTSLQLRLLAQAMDDYDSAWKYWRERGTTDRYGVRVEWSWGGSVDGYKPLAAEVTRIVEEMLDEIAQQALVNLKKRMEDLDR